MASIGAYTGQERKARELAVSELGAEKVAHMSDGEIGDWIHDNYAILWGDCEDSLGIHSSDEEVIALIPSDVYRSIADSIVWLQR